MSNIKSKSEIKKMETACQLVGQILATLGEAAKEGVTPNDLDKIAFDLTVQSGAVPAFKGYHGFPKTLCVSINEEVVHGIPDGRLFKNGDIVGIDFGLSIDGWFGDSAITVPIGNISKEAEKLVRVTEESLFRGIEAAVVGNTIGDIGFAVQSHAERNGFSVVRDFVGHGIGRALHEDPQVPNYGKRGSGDRLEEGMVLAIEPMITAGSYKIKILKNNWTAVTVDGSLAAHFEHTIAITENGPIILTERDRSRSSSI